MLEIRIEAVCSLDQRGLTLFAQRPAQLEQVLPHPHEAQRAVAGEVEAADQLLRARLGRLVQQAEARPRGVGAVGGDGVVDGGVVGVEVLRDQPQEGVALGSGEGGVAVENQPRERDAGGLAAARDQVVAQLDQFGRAGARGQVAAAEADEVAPAVADGLEQVAEEGNRRHGTPSAPRP